MSSIKIIANTKIYLNDHWQTPVITEKKIKDLIEKNPVLAEFDNYRDETITIDYYAVPWATYIDVMTQNAQPNIQTKFRNVISELQKTPSKDPFTFTVCQHIYFRKIIPILKRIGIKILFTPHAQKGKEIIDGIDVLGLPLYPIHAPQQTQQQKEYLYSFAGAYNPQVYMSDIRKRILFDMQHPTTALVKNTNQWHFEKHVYQQQMKGIALTQKDHTELNQKKKHLQRNTFKIKIFFVPQWLRTKFNTFVGIVESWSDTNRPQ